MTKEENYIPYYYDALFYKIFGDEKDVSLLKTIIELSLDIEIDELTIVNGKILGDKHKTKKSYLDLYVKLKDDTKINIEVNSNTENYIFDRNLFFLSKIMANDIEIGGSYHDFKKHYQINFNASNTRQKQKVMKYNVMNKETGEIFSDKMEIVNIDLVSFYELCYTNSTLDNLSDFEKIMGLLGCKTKEEEKLFEHEKGIIEKIMKKAEKFRDDSEMIEMYDRDKVIASMYEKDKKESIKKAVELAVSETTKEVTKEVAKKEKQDIAVNLINKGIDINIISESTGLSLDEVKKLKEEL